MHVRRSIVCLAAAAFGLVGCGGQESESSPTAALTAEGAETTAQVTPTTDATTPPADPATPTASPGGQATPATTPEPTGAPSGDTSPPEQVAGDGKVLVAADGSYQAVMPDGWIPASDLQFGSDTDLDVPIDNLPSEAAALLDQMDLDEVPWMAFDISNASADVVPNANLLAAGPAGGLTAVDILPQLSQQAGTFGDTAITEHRVETVAGQQAVVYDYRLSVDGQKLTGRQVVLIVDDTLFFLTITTGRDQIDGAVVDQIAGSISTL